MWRGALPRRHCEACKAEAIQGPQERTGLLRSARNDIDGRPRVTLSAATCVIHNIYQDGESELADQDNTNPTDTNQTDYVPPGAQLLGRLYIGSART